MGRVGPRRARRLAIARVHLPDVRERFALYAIDPVGCPAAGPGADHRRRHAVMTWTMPSRSRPDDGDDGTALAALPLKLDLGLIWFPVIAVREIWRDRWTALVPQVRAPPEYPECLEILNERLIRQAQALGRQPVLP